MRKDKEMTLAPILLSAAAAALSAIALVLNPAEAAELSLAARYQQERAACLNGQSNQDRATCLKEAGAAFAEGRRGGLTATNTAANATQRCQPLAGAERRDCLDRMQENINSNARGSVAAGGIYRETVTTVPTVPTVSTAPVAEIAASAASAAPR